MERHEILDDLEKLQDEAYDQGFIGSNERELFLRESIADYILSKLHQPTVISAVCEHTKGSCKTIDGKHVMTCDDCHKIIWTQNVKKCDNIWCEDGKVNVYGNEWQSCPQCANKQTDL